MGTVVELSLQLQGKSYYVTEMTRKLQNINNLLKNFGARWLWYSNSTTFKTILIQPKGHCATERNPNVNKIKVLNTFAVQYIEKDSEEERC